MPTIPSRFEVTLFKGDREHKGFGSNALRFDSVQLEEIPGPGNYGQRKAFHQEMTDRAGWGIRGTGGFASRSTRFGMRSLPQMPTAGLGCPGPGAYTPSLMRDHRDFNQAAATSAFAATSAGSRVPVERIAPGPGQYKVCDTKASAKDAAGAQAAFKSTSTRGVDTSDAGSKPGPGAYHDGVPTAIHLGPSEGSGGSSFKVASQPKITRVHRDLPAVSTEVRRALGQFGDEVSHELRGEGGLAVKLPGPGQYNLNRDVIWEGRVAGALGHSGFVPGTKRTDFSNEKLASLPGPGRYNPQSVEGGINLTSAVSSFQSGTQRIGANAGAAPGPAYYDVQLPKEKKSFRMRAGGRQWLPG